MVRQEAKAALMETIELADGGIILYQEGFLPPELACQYFIELKDNVPWEQKPGVFGREVLVAIPDGKMDFGPWEKMFYSEFERRRPNRVLVKVIGE
jgi:thiamine phosphate synthase YjbQ (UPF0047 family)